MFKLTVFKKNRVDEDWALYMCGHLVTEAKMTTIVTVMATLTVFTPSQSAVPLKTVPFKLIQFR